MGLANFDNKPVYLLGSHRSVYSFPRKIKHMYCNNWAMYCLKNFSEKFLGSGISIACCFIFAVRL